MKNIKLVYWHSTKYNNFGDELSPYLIEELSGLKVKWLQGYKGKYKTLKLVIKSALKFKWKEISNLLFPYEKNLLAIGSILEMGNSCSSIWGTGLGNRNRCFHGGKIYALRGMYTDIELQRRGYTKCGIYGDPALLLPIIYKSNTKKKYKLGIIPHIHETEKFISQFSEKNKVIPLTLRKDQGVEDIIDQITSCSLILSSSLHGIIVAHAYGIPALRIGMGDKNEDGIKFEDYFSSVGITPYKALPRFEEILGDNKLIDNFFENNADKSMPRESIVKIQRELLNVAPFPLKPEYKGMHEAISD